jgi:hypothetical protein
MASGTPSGAESAARSSLTASPSVCSARSGSTSAASRSYIAGWGEAGALDAIREHAQTIDTIARRIEAALDPGPDTGPADDAIAVPPLAA